MKYQIIFLVSLACVLIATEAVPTKVCEPGTVFKVECNTCKCSSDGTDMACTRKRCIGGEEAETENEQNDESAKGSDNAAEQKECEQKEEEQKDDSEHCVPGETFKKDCNDCSCPPSGLKSGAACTLIACLDEFQKV